MLLLFLVGFLLREGPIVYAQESSEADTAVVTDAEQLAQAMRDGVASISIESRITGLVLEQVALGGSLFDLGRYTSFPEVLFPLGLSSC